MKTEKGPCPEALAAFLDILGLDEAPMGVRYEDAEPEGGVGPKPQAPLSREAEEKGEIDWQAVMGNFSCVLGQVWRARKKRTAACFDRERFGCLGGAFQLGYLKPYLHMHPPFISTGIPGVFPGERYCASPEAAAAFFDAIDPPPAPKRWCVIRPVERSSEADPPEVVVFFARPEVASGLAFFTNFITGDIDAVRVPFGPGCAGLVSWPLKYLREGREWAVLGGMDPSCRKFLKTDELTFAVPYSLYRKMLDRWPESFLAQETWQGVRKKIERSKKAWGESEG